MDNNILHRSEFTGNGGKDITDLYKLRMTPELTGNQYMLQIMELNDAHSYFDRINLYAIDHPSGTEIGITEENEIVLYDDANFIYANANGPQKQNRFYEGVSRLKGDQLQLSFSENLLREPVPNFKSSVSKSSLIQTALFLDVASIEPPVAEGGSEPPPPKEIAGTIVLGDNEYKRDFARREQRSMAIIPLNTNESVTQLDVNWNRVSFLHSAALCPVSYAGSEKTKLPLLSAKHSDLGEIKTQLTEIDQQYAELESSDLLSLTFENSKGVEAGWIRDFVFEVIGRYETPDSYSQFSSSPHKSQSLTKHIPSQFSLEQNYPNPFNPSTAIRYALPQSELVTLKVYDMLGKEVKTLVNAYQPAGLYSGKFDGTQLSSGIYVYKIQAGEFTKSKKMLLTK